MINKVFLIGNLSKDVDFTTTNNGTSVARFTIAVQRKYTNENGEREADFINCVAWRTTAENLNKYCKKGDKIAVVGAIQVRSYQAQDGTKRYATEVIADEIEFVNTKRADSQQPELTPVEDDGELPF